MQRRLGFFANCTLALAIYLLASSEGYFAGHTSMEDVAAQQQTASVVPVATAFGVLDQSMNEMAGRGVRAGKDKFAEKISGL